MESNRNSYSNIFKAISIFGGTQVFSILIGIIRNKFVALLLGPFGMGISGLLTSTTSLVKTMTDMGLRTSSVRDIARSYNTGNTEKISRTTTAMRKLVWCTGLLGMLIVLALAQQFSIWTFGNTDYTWAFRIVSITLLLDQICVGQTVLMQGTFHYKYLAKASILGSVIGLFISVPLFYFFRIKAIAPVILIASITSLSLSWFYSRKVGIKSCKMSMKDVITEGRVMIGLGIAIALSGMLGEGKNYITRLFISNAGIIEDVGLYTAGITIATQYVNIILNAMASDYSPRLASVSADNDQFIDVINRQNKLMMTVMIPFILMLILFIKPIILLLYSSEFIAITGMIEWVLLGMFFRAMSWCLSYTLVAKGESRFFFFSELTVSIYSLVLFMVGYKFINVTGVGIAFCLTYFLYTVQYLLICKKKFGFKYSKDNVSLLAAQISFTLFVFLMLKLCGDTSIRYIIGLPALGFAFVFSYKKFNEMVPVKPALVGLFSKIKCR